MFQIDKNNSPVLAVPHSNTSIILTAPRFSDGPSIIEIQNDPSVYMNLLGLPFPYTQADWDSWFPIHTKAVDLAVEEWKAINSDRSVDLEGRPWKERKWLSKGIPCPVIREIDKQTGIETFLGEISIRRAGFIMVLDQEERKELSDANERLEAGDPNIEWEIGFYLSPSCHGRGIMPVVLRSVIERIGVPYMNVHRLTGTYFDQNQGSRRVFEKCGFSFDTAVPDAIELPESKMGAKGKRAGLERMKWKAVI